MVMAGDAAAGTVMAREHRCPCCGQELDEIETCCSVSFWCDPCQRQYMEGDFKTLIIDFLYLDLTVCDRCQGAEDNLTAAIDRVSDQLTSAKVSVEVNKINVVNEQQAKKLRFASSPTIRINGRDIQPVMKETYCDACGELCGDSIECRVWLYGGQEYTVPPQDMIAEAILRAAESGTEQTTAAYSSEFVVPENLERFFDRLRRQEHSKGSCCGD